MSKSWQKIIDGLNTHADGKAHPVKTVATDEAGGFVAIRESHGEVQLDFGEAVDCVGIAPQEAINLAVAMMRCALLIAMQRDIKIDLPVLL